MKTLQERQNEANELKEKISIVQNAVQELEDKIASSFTYMEKYPGMEQAVKNAQELAREIYGEDLKTEKEFLKQLKIKLSEYDVYQQKSPYQCLTCREVDCVCDSLASDVPDF